MEKQRTYLCIDLKSFYASVECAERGLDPMTTNLVVADPERSEKTICLAVSPSMKALGISNRCRVFQIPKSVDYIMATPRMQLYIDHAWGREPVTIADIKAYKPKNTCLTSGQVLSCDYEYEKGKLVVKEMADTLCLELLDKGLLTGNISLHVGYSNQLGREPARGSVTLDSPTDSAKTLVQQTATLFDKIIDKSLPIRRMNLSFNNLTDEAYQQYDLFADPAELEKERKARQAMLDIRKKFGKNAILKGMDLVEGATAMERNRQIGGHKSGE